MKSQSQENSYKRQLIGVGAFVALVVVILAAVVIPPTVANRPRPSARARGTDPASQLANDMERAFPSIFILGVDENPEDKRVVVLLFDSDPFAVWEQAENDKMDAAALLAMEFASEADSDLTINILFETLAVTLQGESVSALLVNYTVLCFLADVEDIDWGRADTDTIKDNCTMLPAGRLWENAEGILWPLEASR